MPYNTLMNITFVLSVLGVILLVLRHLPQATKIDKQTRLEKQSQQSPEVHHKLVAMGLPVMAYSKSKALFRTITHKIWQFILEAKGLKQSPKISYQFQKIFQEAKSDLSGTAVIKNEQYYIDLIKRNPKDNGCYDMLGQYYIQEKKMPDAVNVYEYLVTHVPNEVMYWVRLGLASLYLQENQRAKEAYQKAVELDPTHPSRFYNLALAEQGLKDFDSAIVAINQALDLEPKNQKYKDLRFELESKLALQKR